MLLVGVRTFTELDDTNHNDNDQCRHFGNGEDVLDSICPADATAVDERQKY